MIINRVLSPIIINIDKFGKVTKKWKKAPQGVPFFYPFNTVIDSNLGGCPGVSLMHISKVWSPSSSNTTAQSPFSSFLKLQAVLYMNSEYNNISFIGYRYLIDY